MARELERLQCLRCPQRRHRQVCIDYGADGYEPGCADGGPIEHGLGR